MQNEKMAIENQDFLRQAVAYDTLDYSGASATMLYILWSHISLHNRSPAFNRDRPDSSLLNPVVVRVFYAACASLLLPPTSSSRPPTPNAALTLSPTLTLTLALNLSPTPTPDQLQQAAYTACCSGMAHQT